MTHLVSTVLILAVCVAGMVWDVDISYSSGAVVIKGAPFQFQLNGMIWGYDSAHEFGHLRQQQYYGDEVYYFLSFLSLPVSGIINASYRNADTDQQRVGLINLYYRRPWEANAQSFADLEDKQWRIEQQR